MEVLKKVVIAVLFVVAVWLTCYSCAIIAADEAKEELHNCSSISVKTVKMAEVASETIEMIPLAEGDEVEGLDDEKADIFKESVSALEILKKLDVDQDERLNLEEFGAMCENLFRNTTESYKLESEDISKLFKIFDWNSNDFICKDEFEICYKTWIYKITNPTSVLVVVDVQNDFINGTLALKNGPSGQDGKEVVEPINELLDTVPFEFVFYTRDWHPANHISFVDNAQLYKLHNSSKIQDAKTAKTFDTVTFEGENGKEIVQKLWPAHAIQDSWGAELDADLKIVENSKEVFKGLEPGIDSYSAFLDYEKKPASPLKNYIEDVGALDVYVVGLALDFCVGYTSLDSLDLGFRTVVVEDATRSIDLDKAEEMKKDIATKKGLVISKDKVKDMVLGKDRRPEMGIYLAEKLRVEKLNEIKNQV